ncbi:MAG: hypothetical protein V1847_03760 [Candidatus Diapherotrites archaeon]
MKLNTILSQYKTPEQRIALVKSLLKKRKFSAAVLAAQKFRLKDLEIKAYMMFEPERAAELFLSETKKKFALDAALAMRSAKTKEELENAVREFASYFEQALSEANRFKPKTPKKRTCPKPLKSRK